MPKNKPTQIYVTQPALPPLEDFLPYLEKIWESKILTNCGPFHQQLELQLSKYLGVEYVCLFTNATIALLTALQSLRIKGEVITTPFTFAATPSALYWNGIKPIFVDININTFNLDPNKIEAAITENTTAIMPVHCYGTPCDVDAIQKIADNYNLKVIYDAAHAFGVKHENNSILCNGDLSILSFHATKVFNTFEGGAIICPDLKTKTHIDHLKNFGHINETTVVAAGINGKMSEFNAALGILQLENFSDAISKRKAIHDSYIELLKHVVGITIPLNLDPTITRNYSYFPILVNEDCKISRDDLYNHLKQNNINPRRYFFPLVSEFPMYKLHHSAKMENLPNATYISRRILCLPIYPDLSLLDVHRICDTIIKATLE
jgi:dTDP-4-amino-4,6-dideoxygalactose transaminase